MSSFVEVRNWKVGEKMTREFRRAVAGCLIVFACSVSAFGQTKEAAEQPKQVATEDESRFLAEIFQLTYEGKRSGEGYFSADGKKLVYQSEQEPSNPFYQIYLFDFDKLDSQLISPGHGKTTCSWIHPDGTKILYASTQNDPDALKKQKAEIEMRESGNERRYAWDYDETYDLIEYDFETKEYRSLTTEKGYDAEASYSPDGKLIAFASNRNGYSKKLTPEQQKAFDIDPAYMMDLFIMNADGTNVRQLTDVPGYDGGPFFSFDGKKICWRRFSENGAVAEIYTMNVDGTEQKQITNMRAMSWAPYFHPSGKYLIFTTNKMGFDNFELFLVDVEGKSQPVRVTTTHGFDGLATWDRTGERFTWTSNRGADNLSQIYVGQWNHEAALKALGLTEDEDVNVDQAQAAADASSQETTPDYTPVDFRKHVEYLCQGDLAGRMTGSAGERKATAYVAAYMDHLGLQPAGDDGTWFQKFEFPAGAKLTVDNLLKNGKQVYELNKDWRPLAFSKIGPIDASEVVFAGYGIVAPGEGEIGQSDSYYQTDVKDKWVLVFRYFPEDVDDKTRQYYVMQSNLRKKVMDARDKGASGIIIVSGPNSFSSEQLVALERDFSISGSSIAAISVTDEVAASWLKSSGKDLKQLQDELDTGKHVMGFALQDVSLAVTVGVEQVTGVGRNVLGRLKVGNENASESIVVGAHIDHLGTGRSSSSLARDDETTMIHFGADDNASGVAAMLEVAEHLVRVKEAGELDLKRDVIFAAWSGEELGLRGSDYFVKSVAKRIEGDSKSIYPTIAACLNMDMVGRYDGALILQGMGSSDYWKKAIQKNAATRLTLKPSDETTLPTDASSFYQAGVPILSAFTGSHKDYHTPRDTPEKLNYDEASRIAKLMGLIAMALATDSTPPVYKLNTAASSNANRPRSGRVVVGSIPDYAGDVAGVLLSGVTPGSPAEAAGVKGGDVVVELAGRKIENIQEYSIVISALKAGEETTIVVMRNEERVELKLTPVRSNK